VGAPRADGRLPKWLYLWRVPRVRRLLRELRPDVVMATYVQSNGLVGALTRCAPLVISTRGVDWEFPLPRALRDPLVRWIFARADRLHASSAELVERLAELGVPPERFRVVPLGTDAAAFRPRSAPREPGPPRILCTRKHFPIYDNGTILRALRILADQGFAFECRFVGASPGLEGSRALAASLGLAERVAFLGDRPPGEIPALLVWADLYVSAALSDGSPSSLFEAMSCAHFPVVSDVRANRDWIEHRRSGYLFRPGDPADCAAGLRFAWQQEALRREGGARNRALVEARLDRRRGLEQIEALLQEAASGGGRKRG
jgi:glycosyltransferase involved in cell wall biosynthesis